MALRSDDGVLVALLGGGILIGGAALIYSLHAPTGREAHTALTPVAADIDDWIGPVVRTTAAFEGGGAYDKLNLNTDGNGLSFGLVQWAQGSGALGVLLAALYAADARAFASDFGPMYAQVLTTTTAPTRSLRLAPVGGVVLWAEPWVSRFVRAGARAAFQGVQRQQASASYLDAARGIARLLNVRTERALALFYDRVVQQGIYGAPVCARELAGAYAENPALRPADSRDVLAQFGAVCAERFRRPQRPAPIALAGIVWVPVLQERRATGAASYTVPMVPAAPTTQHGFSGSIDLYNDILRRVSAILLDPRLRDAPVNLDSTEVPTTLGGFGAATRARHGQFLPGGG